MSADGAPAAVAETAAAEDPGAPAPVEAAENAAMADLRADGRRSTILRRQTSASEPTVVLMIDGLEYDTGIESDEADVSMHLVDLDSDGASEIMLVHRSDTGAHLYMYRMTEEGLLQASFTYEIPPELSGTGLPEERTDSEYLVFSGIEPIVALRDGSFAVLSFGSEFQRYAVGPDMRVTEAGRLPLDILTNGDVPPLKISTKEPDSG